MHTTYAYRLHSILSLCNMYITSHQLVFPLDSLRPANHSTCQALKLCAAKDPWKVIYTKADRNNKADLI